MKLYLDSGYLNVPGVKSCNVPNIFITGARGTGKTYGELYDLIEKETPFILMRRTMAELEFLGKDESTNPFIPINAALGTCVGLEKSGKYLYRIVDREYNENGEYRVIRRCGIAVALSTIANIRGFDGSPYEELFFDEFIPERHARPIREEFYAFMNALETVGRNRELQGKPPLRVVCAANSNRLDNPIYLGLNLVRKADAMKRKKQTVCILEKRGICLINLEDSPISQAKRETSLYKMAAGSGFADMALDNKYIGEKEYNPLIRRANLKEYTPLAAIGEICVYEHKTRQEYYVCSTVSGSPPSFDMTDTDKERFKRAYWAVWAEYFENCVFFEDRLSELLLTKVFT